MEGNGVNKLIRKGMEVRSWNYCRKSRMSVVAGRGFKRSLNVPNLHTTQLSREGWEEGGGVKTAFISQGQWHFSQHSCWIRVLDCLFVYVSYFPKRWQVEITWPFQAWWMICIPSAVSLNSAAVLHTHTHSQSTFMGFVYKSDYFRAQHKQVYSSRVDTVCFLRGTNQMFK